MPIAAIGAIVGAGSSLFGAISANKKANQALDEQKRLNDANIGLINQQKESSAFALQNAKQFLPQATGYLDTVGNVYKKIFSGNRDSVNQQLAPDINSYLSNMSSADRNLRIFSGRGAIGDRLINSDFTKSANLANMRLGARQQAGGVLQNLGSIYGQLGLNSLAIGGNQAASASAALTSLSNQAFQSYLYNDQKGSQFGSNLSTLLGSFNWKAKSIKDFFGSSGAGATGITSGDGYGGNYGGDLTGD